MQLEILTLNQKDKDKCISDHLYVKSKIWPDDLIYKTETDHGHGEQTCGFLVSRMGRAVGGGAMGWMGSLGFVGSQGDTGGQGRELA